MGVSREGRHYPLKKFADWRDMVVRDLRFYMNEAKQACTYFDTPCLMRVKYWSGDHRRRDITAMVDSLFHCMERAELIKDDALIRQLEWYPYGYSKENPRAEILISEL